MMRALLFAMITVTSRTLVNWKRHIYFTYIVSIYHVNTWAHTVLSAVFIPRILCINATNAAERYINHPSSQIAISQVARCPCRTEMKVVIAMLMLLMSKTGGWVWPGVKHGVMAPCKLNCGFPVKTP